MTKPLLIKYGFIKPAIDAHTMGINSAAELLRDCGYDVLLADKSIGQAIGDYKSEARRQLVVDWIIENKITRLGISYRLDQADAVNMVGYTLEALKSANLMKFQGGQIDLIFFGGLPATCQKIGQEFKGLVKTFVGGESVKETLLKMGVPEDKIPLHIYQASRYDELLLAFGKEIIDKGEYLSYKPVDRSGYPAFASKNDSLLKRLDQGAAYMEGPEKALSSSQPSINSVPLMRAHVGPYSSSATRMESVLEFLDWSKKLASSGYLDILSIGSSQLTQSNFGEDWTGKANGGGVPVNSAQEYRMIYQASRPLLVRTYAGTKKIRDLAQMHEETLNICWHALSLWWFNQLDGRGPYDLYTNLKQHINTIKYIAKTGKPFEANVPHHFAFRGADDVTYIVSAYLAAKLAKKLGIKTFILQNMLNTPRFTWGIQDLAKSRAMLKLVRSLEDSNFRVLLQPRAGLDYFKPDLDEAKIQLAAVTALMDDIEPLNEASPSIIHVVSYSEASHLATPDVIDESIKITQHSLQKYRELRKQGLIDDMSKNSEVDLRTQDLYAEALEIISAIESRIDNPYSAEGFYKIFVSGFLPVPYLWSEAEEVQHAKNWTTKPLSGSVKVVDKDSEVMPVEKRIAIALDNLKDAEYWLEEGVGK